MDDDSLNLDLKELKIEVTYRCNLNCIHCSSDAHPSNELEMSRDDCIRIINEASELGAQELAFSGGEPLQWPHIIDVVGEATQHNLNVTVYTSGYPDESGQFLAGIAAAGARRCVFSIFGASSSNHERVTRRIGSFERMKASLANAIATGLEVEAHFVPMSQNYRELPAVVDMALQMGVTRVSILRLVPQGRGALLGNRILSRVQNLELRRDIFQLRNEHGDAVIRTGSPYNFLMVNDEPRCYAAQDRLTIAPDQTVAPCDAFKRIDAVDFVEVDEWNTLEGAGLGDVWSKSTYLNAVRAHLASAHGEPCEPCRTLQKCNSGCAAQKAIAYGALVRRPDPDCLGPSPRGKTS